MRGFTRVKLLDTDDICPVEEFLSSQFTITRTLESGIQVTQFLFYKDKGVEWIPIINEEA